MTAAPDDPNDRARRALARLREAISDKTHWVFVTDDPLAARSLRGSAGTDALYLEAVMCFTDCREVFRVAALAVSKRAWPPCAALRVAEAATSGRGPRPDAARVRGGAALFTISGNPERLAVVVQQIRDGAVALHAPSERG